MHLQSTCFIDLYESRSLSSKLELGRRGTCQVSPYDHIYLAVFWAYNSVSIVVFHYFLENAIRCVGYSE